MVGAIRMRQQLLKHTLSNLWHFHYNIFYSKKRRFWYITVYMCSEYSQIYLLKDTKDISSRYLNVKIYAAKIHCYFWRAQTYLSFIFNLLFYFYYEWNHRVVSLKVWVKVNIFDWVSFLLNFTFLLDKMHGVFGKFFISFKTKIMEKLNTNLSIKLWFLSCNKMFWNPIISLWVWARHKLITR